MIDEAILGARGPVVRYLISLGARWEDAEDAVQDAILQALIRPPTRYPVTWLHTVARRAWLGTRKRAAMESSGCSRRVWHDMPEAEASTRELVMREVREVVERDPESRLLRLLYWHGLSPKQMTPHVGLAWQTIYERLHRAAVRLRCALAGMLDLLIPTMPPSLEFMIIGRRWSLAERSVPRPGRNPETFEARQHQMKRALQIRWHAAR